MWKRIAFTALAVLVAANTAGAARADSKWGRLGRAAARDLGGFDTEFTAEANADSLDTKSASAAAQPLAEAQPRRRKCKSGRGVIIQDMIQAKDLFPVKPPDWQYCGFECAENTTLNTSQSTGEIFIQVVHKPIANVTPEMIEWWFRGNVEGDMVHPIDGQTYSRYHVWHPRDHLYQRTKKRSKAARKDPTSTDVDGAQWRITEFILASRTYLSNDSNCVWADEHFASDDLEVVKLDASGLSMQLAIGLKNKPMRMQHAWSASPEGLRLTSTLRIGFQQQGNRPASTTKRYNNRYTRPAFGGKDPEGSAVLWQKHCLEEFSNLKHFLPQLYTQVTGKP
ncbi:MAG: hypothetical protein J3K34DRAFT_407931 [Monoraphidium minutum]|nr:MAG: hypothetical protein J3K34DRAFT_407931 [Monoraphidium minutum]